MLYPKTWVLKRTKSPGIESPPNSTKSLNYTKSFDPWRNSHDVFWFRHRSHYIHDKHSNFVIDWQCWIWSPIWSANTMTLCQFRHKFHHISHCIHDNWQISSLINNVGYETQYDVQTLWRCANFVIDHYKKLFNMWWNSRGGFRKHYGFALMDIKPRKPRQIINFVPVRPKTLQRLYKFVANVN
jgi:hypothetical protein